MKTKDCSCCKEELPLSEFHKNKKNRSGLSSYCKKCHTAKNFVYKKERLVKTLKLENSCDVLGGYKITILNHAKKGEKKYNILPIGGELFATNSKNEFMEYLEAI